MKIEWPKGDGLKKCRSGAKRLRNMPEVVIRRGRAADGVVEPIRNGSSATVGRTFFRIDEAAADASMERTSKLNGGTSTETRPSMPGSPPNRNEPRQ